MLSFSHIQNSYNLHIKGFPKKLAQLLLTELFIAIILQ